MTIDRNHPLVGRQVVYRGTHPNAEAEQGTVTSVNEEAGLLFVNYGRGSTSAATEIESLTFLNGEKVKFDAPE